LIPFMPIRVPFAASLRRRPRLRAHLFAVGLLAATSVFGQKRLPAPHELPPLPPPPPFPKELLNRVPPAPPPGLPDENELRGQLRQLEELLSLPAENLKRMRETIEMLERMSPEQRESLRLRLLKFKELSPALTREIDQLAPLLPESDRRMFRDYWISLTEEQRAAARERLAQLDTNGKTLWLDRETTAFAQRRDELFRTMREQLEARRREAAARASNPDNGQVKP